MNRTQRLRLALGVLSGRLSVSGGLHPEDWRALGYDADKLSYYGVPSDNDLRLKCEAIVFDALVPIQPVEKEESHEE